MLDKELDQYAAMINALLAECIQCSPATWNEGLLSIDSDGLYINYKLKNTHSKDTASISGPLREYCEELYFLMRQNGDIWTDASLHYVRQGADWDYDIKFNYSNKKIKRPWWKFFETAFDAQHFEGVWYAETLDKKYKRDLISRSSFSMDGTATTEFKIRFADGTTYEDGEAGSWSLQDGLLIKVMKSKEGIEHTSKYPVISASKKIIQYKDPLNGTVYKLKKAAPQLEKKWHAFLDKR